MSDVSEPVAATNSPDDGRVELPREHDLAPRRWRMPNGSIVGEAINHEAVELLKNDPGEYFRRTRQPTDEPVKSGWYWHRPDCADNECQGCATQPQPTDEPIQRFGLTLTKADFDKLGAALEVINEAERRTLAGPDYVTAVAQIRALHQKADGGFACAQCIAQDYPCATVRALDKAGAP